MVQHFYPTNLLGHYNGRRGRVEGAFPAKHVPTWAGRLGARRDRRGPTSKYVEELINRAIEINNHQGERWRERSFRHATPRSPACQRVISPHDQTHPPPTTLDCHETEPMQLGRACLTETSQHWGLPVLLSRAAKRVGSSVQAGALARASPSCCLSRVSLPGTLFCAHESLPLSLWTGRCGCRASITRASTP